MVKIVGGTDDRLSSSVRQPALAKDDRRQKAIVCPTYLFTNFTSTSIQVFGSSSTEAGSWSAAISNLCCLPVISIFSILAGATPTSSGKRKASPGCVCARLISIFRVAELRSEERRVGKVER